MASLTDLEPGWLGGELLRSMVDSYQRSNEVGTMTCTIYDTAWLAMVSRNVDGIPQWLFPSSFSHVLKTQSKSGGWRDHESPIDRILNTAAALLALCQHREKPLQLNSTTEELEHPIHRATLFLKRELDRWDVKTATHVGFEVLVPAMLDHLEGYDIRILFKGRPTLYRLRDAKLSKVDWASLEDARGKTHSIMHSLEGLVGRLNFDNIKHHKVFGSMMASPAATAAYLMFSSSWDEESEAYLRHVIEAGPGKGNGSVPSAFPSTLFEFSWVSRSDQCLAIHTARFAQTGPRGC